MYLIFGIISTVFLLSLRQTLSLNGAPARTSSECGSSREVPIDPTRLCLYLRLSRQHQPEDSVQQLEQLLLGRVGAVTFDLFASHSNAQTKKFASLMPDPECTWVDSMKRLLA